MTLKTGRGARHEKLWQRLCREVEIAPITEAYVLATEKEYIEGFCDLERGSITIAPHTHVVSVVIHELLHRIYPERSERSVRRSTTILLKTLTDDEIQWFYAEYQRRKQAGEVTEFEE
jgi:hypothetical protein